MKNACCALVIGVVMFLSAFPVLFYNEGGGLWCLPRCAQPHAVAAGVAVRTARSLDEGQRLVAPVPAAEPLPQYNGRLVHISSAVKELPLLGDAEVGASMQALKLVREVEMYQWHEHESTSSYRDMSGTEHRETRYSYDARWSTQTQRTRDHSFANPDWPLRADTFVPPFARVGGFRLPGDLIDQLTDARALSAGELEHVKEQIGAASWQALPGTQRREAIGGPRGRGSRHGAASKRVALHRGVDGGQMVLHHGHFYVGAWSRGAARLRRAGSAMR